MILRRFNAIASAIIFFVFTFIRNADASCLGCVELDEITFDKMISHFDYTLVKFDIAFPYGPKHEVFGDFAKNYGSKLSNLLVGLVGVKDYGEKENRMLSQRYQVDEKAYPEIILFLNGDHQKYQKYPKNWDITIDNLKRFVAQHTKIYIPLDGCIEEFDKFVTEFTGKTEKEMKETIVKANKARESLDSEAKERATIYIRLMEKIVEKGTDEKFIVDERKRVEKLLKEKITDKKRKQLIQRQNILQSFRISSDRLTQDGDKKEEL